MGGAPNHRFSLRAWRRLARCAPQAGSLRATCEPSRSRACRPATLGPPLALATPSLRPRRATTTWTGHGARIVRLSPWLGGERQLLLHAERVQLPRKQAGLRQRGRLAPGSLALFDRPGDVRLPAAREAQNWISSWRWSPPAQRGPAPGERLDPPGDPTSTPMRREPLRSSRPESRDSRSTRTRDADRGLYNDGLADYPEPVSDHLGSAILRCAQAELPVHGRCGLRRDSSGSVEENTWLNHVQFSPGPHLLLFRPPMRVV